MAPLAEAWIAKRWGILTLARIDPLYVEVIIVDRVVDAASGTFGVRLQLPNASLRVPPGIKCRVRLPGL